MGRRNIAIVNQPWGMIRPPVTTGGSIPILLYELGRRLAAGGDQVSYYTRGSYRARTRVEAGMTFRYIPIVYDKLVQKLRHRLGLHRSSGDARRPDWASDRSYGAYAAQLARDLRRIGAQVIHLNNLSQFIPIVRRRNPGAVIAIQMHCEWLTQLDPGLIRPRLEQADLVLGVSDYITGKVAAAFPDLADRCRTLHNGVDPSRFPLATARFERDAPRELVYVGRITPEKGVHVLIDAFRLLRREFPELRLRLVGPDEINPPELVVHISDDPRLHAMLPLFDSRRYRALLAEKLQGLEDAVTFTGNIPHGPRLAEQFGSADVCVFPSIWDEPFGIPVIEAMCTGAPVVITRGGAYPELVEDGTSGLLVDPEDAGALAAALRALLGNAALRRAVGHAAHARACSMFSWDLLASRLSGYYDEARARRAASASPAAD